MKVIDRSQICTSSGTKNVDPEGGATEKVMGLLKSHGLIPQTLEEKWPATFLQLKNPM